MNQHPDIHNASQLIRTGRYLEAVRALRALVTARGRVPIIRALLADVLQRVGHNAQAQEIALEHLRDIPRPVKRSRASISSLAMWNEIEGTSRGYRPSSNFSWISPDLELTCWSQPRLVSLAAETSGGRTATARLDDVKRLLARFGDARPFASLHLWLVEAESTRGNLQIAWRNLRTAESLLLQVDDVWLQGYLAER